MPQRVRADRRHILKVMAVTASPERFDPARYDLFRFTGVGVDAARGHVELHYALDELRFTETVELGAPDAPPDEAREQALARVLRLLHLAGGVSYYKTAAPSRLAVETQPLRAAEARWMRELYVEGLGEFAYENGIDLAARVRLDDSGEGARAPVALAPTGRPLVPVGGGKDSIVSIETLRSAGEQPTLFSVGTPVPIVATVQAAGLPHVVATRRLDPGLGALNSRGALNGHVPVTAVVSLIALATAVLHGYDEVVMSNERSASAGNFEWGGLEVNHQYSKGARFEAGLRDVLAAEVTGLEYFSLLRPVSELAIARAFAQLPQYFGAFTSCNAVFRLDPARRAPGWCCNCPKCRFVFLALAPWLDPPTLTGIFGCDMLDDEAQLAGFLALTGLDESKPFECVGETSESVAAFRLVADHPQWRDHAVVRAARERLLPRVPPDFGRPEEALAMGGEHHVPERLLPALRARLGA
jgi:hypothetical protein